MTDQAANALTWVLLILLATQILRAIQIFFDEWFYTPPDFSGIKTYYSDDMLTRIYEDD